MRGSPYYYHNSLAIHLGCPCELYMCTLGLSSSVWVVRGSRVCRPALWLALCGWTGPLGRPACGHTGREQAHAPSPVCVCVCVCVCHTWTQLAQVTNNSCSTTQTTNYTQACIKCIISKLKVRTLQCGEC